MLKTQWLGLPGSAVTAGSAVASGGRLLGPGTMTAGRGGGVALDRRSPAAPTEVTPSETASGGACRAADPFAAHRARRPLPGDYLRN
jgi:hypothetical protein